MTSRLAPVPVRGIKTSARDSARHPRISTGGSGHAGIGAILLAGLMGGAAEVIWIGLYAWSTPLDGATVSRAVATTVFPALTDPLAAAIAGVAIHFTLSVGMAALFYRLVWRPLADITHGLNAALLASFVTLAGVWSVNFLVVLPAVNPEFVTLLPYSVTLVSKLLFGVVMGWTLYRLGNEPDVDL